MNRMYGSNHTEILPYLHKINHKCFTCDAWVEHAWVEKPNYKLLLVGLLLNVHACLHNLGHCSFDTPKNTVFRNHLKLFVGVNS